MKPAPNYYDIFKRQALALGSVAQRRIRKSSVAVFGCGGVGAATIATLAGAGIGEIILVDPQTVEPDNLNRLPLATVNDVGRPKVSVLRRTLRKRPSLTVTAVRGLAEDPQVLRAVSRANLLVSASNTINSRIAVAGHALAHGQIHVG